MHAPRLTRNERLLIAGGVLVALAFAVYTQHAWEDYYITYRSSKNLARGLGLVFQPGERVHAFTSPIGVLLPALLSAIFRNGADGLVLWIFRIISALLFLVTGTAIVRGQRRAGFDAAVTAFTLVLAATEAKVVDFSVNGQESGFVVAFLCVSWACLMAGPTRSTLALAGAWAGLQYARPDGWVYAGCIALGMLLFAPEPLGRGPMLRRMAGAAIWALLFYSPWLMWTTWYYGSPIPHTIIAKQIYAPHHDAQSLLRSALAFPLSFSHATAVIFSPIYSVFGGWPPMVMRLSQALGTLLSIYWILPWAGRHARALSFAFGMSVLYLTQVITPSPWYLPAAVVLGVLALSGIVHDVAALVARLRRQGRVRAAQAMRWTASIGMVATTAFTVTILLLSAYELRIQQREIEEGVRTQIGLWLRRNAAPRDRVFLEPLGYIGFYSGRKMLDFPGLASPDVVAARRVLHTSDWDDLVSYLQPEWLVLRPREIAPVFSNRPDLQRQYQPAQDFDASDDLAAYGWIPGAGYLGYDARFTVFRRVSSTP